MRIALLQHQSAWTILFAGSVVMYAMLSAISDGTKIRNSIAVVADLKLAATEVHAIAHTMAEISRHVSLLSVNTSNWNDLKTQITSR